MTTTINGTTITLSGTYVTAGYGVKSHYTVLNLLSNGTIGGNGLHDTVALAVYNSGRIFGTAKSDGVNLEAGGQLYNLHDGNITGYDNAVRIASATAYIVNSGYIGSNGGAVANTGNAISVSGGTVTNFSTISGGFGKYGAGILASSASADILNEGLINGATGINLVDGGRIKNLSTIVGVGGYGITGATTTVNNFGYIEGSTAIQILAGTIYNDSGAIIKGGAAGIASEYILDTELDITVTNLGEITSTYGVALRVAGQVTNGSVNNTSALIVGGTAGIVSGLDLTLANFGKVDTTGLNTNSVGVQLTFGTITNGSKTDTSAFIAGSADGIVGSDNLCTIDNFGLIRSSLSNPGAYAGVFLQGPSALSVTNGNLGDTSAAIEGAFAGVRLVGTGSVVNFGTISGLDNYGVSLGSSAKVVNGSAASTAATIIGYYGGVLGFSTATIANYGTIRGSNAAINLEGGGTITNGTGGDKVALIESNESAIEIEGAGTVTNNGTLVSVSGHAVSLSGGGGDVTNGSAGNPAALIIGYIDGVTVTGGIGSVANFGTIVTDGASAAKFGVAVYGGGAITNGSGSDKAALIEGDTGAYLPTGGVNNFGTVEGTGANGIRFGSAGNLINGNAADVTALVEGYKVAVSCYGALSVTNFASIVSTGSGGYFAAFAEGGTISNGNLHDSTALMEGAAGVELSAAGSVSNFGTIEATGLSYTVYAGVRLTHGGSITNGASNESLGIITGASGVALSAGGTVTNFGLIEGDVTAAAYLVAGGTVTNFGTLEGAAGADAVVFAAGGLLIAEAGSVFKGVVNGGGGRLEVLGAGTLTGLLASGNVTVSVSLPTPTAFTNFHTVDVGSGSSFTVAGNAAIAAGETLIVAGALSTAGTVSVTGSLASSGTIAGTGTLALAGIESFASGTALTTAYISVTAGTFTPGFSLPYAGAFTMSGGTIAIAHGLDLTGSASFSGGTVSGVGYLQTSGATTLSSLGLNGGAIWQEYGTVIQTGSLTLGDSAGGLGRLVVEAAAVFDLTGNGGISIVSGGTASISNVALFEKTGGTGLSTVAPGIGNTGTIVVTAGTLDLAGTVSGAGQSTIGATGTLEFAGAVASAQTITFAGSTGELVLNDPSGSGLSFAGTISGFAGSIKLDLSTIAYAGTQASWAQNGSSGTLTVTEGSKTAKIVLFGQYASANFKAAIDGASGTLITFVASPNHSIAATHH